MNRFVSIFYVKQSHFYENIWTTIFCSSVTLNPSFTTLYFQKKLCFLHTGHSTPSDWCFCTWQFCVWHELELPSKSLCVRSGLNIWLVNQFLQPAAVYSLCLCICVCVSILNISPKETYINRGVTQVRKAEECRNKNKTAKIIVLLELNVRIFCKQWSWRLEIMLRGIVICKFNLPPKTQM